MKPHKIIEQVFKDEFGEDWGNELRDFEHGFSDYYDCSIKATQQALNIPDVSKYVFCPYCGMKRDYIVTTDINSGKTCKNPLCKGK